jgi:hypothetical protein
MANTQPALFDPSTVTARAVNVACGLPTTAMK